MPRREGVKATQRAAIARKVQDIVLEHGRGWYEIAKADYGADWPFRAGLGGRERNAGEVLIEVNAAVASDEARQVAADRAEAMLRRYASADIRDLYDDNNAILPIRDWPDHIAACVTEVTTTKDGDLRVKLVDKLRSNETVLKLAGRFVEKSEVNHTGTLTLEERLARYAAEEGDGG